MDVEEKWYKMTSGFEMKQTFFLSDDDDDRAELCFSDVMRPISTICVDRLDTWHRRPSC